MLYSVNPGNLYTGFSVIEGVQNWSQAAESRMLWVKGVHEEQYPSSASAIAAKVISVALKLQIPTVFFFCNVADQSNYPKEYDMRFESTFVDCVYSPIRQLISVLAPYVEGTRGLEKARFVELDGSFESLDTAIELLKELLMIVPRTLIVVIDGLDRIAKRGFDKGLTRFLMLLETVLVEESMSRVRKHMVLKILFTSAGYCDIFGVIDKESLDIVFALERTPKHLARRGRLMTELHLINATGEENTTGDTDDDDNHDDE